MDASAMPIPIKANSRAFSSSVLPCASATVWAIRIQWPGGVEVPVLLAQNRAILVWSAVRVALVADPISLTSRKLAVYSGLSNAGGPLGSRNCDPLVIAHGVTNRQFGKSGAANAGGVGIQSPGSE